MRVKDIIIGVMMLLAAQTVQAQITIAGNVYGGGNAGPTGGSTKVTVHAGDLNNVYGGARMADVKGSAFVNIDGQHASDNIFINNVYGGNDIAGTIGTEGKTVTVPTELTEIGTGAGKNNINGSWNAFVRTSPTLKTTNPADRLSLVIGSLFGGGNGDYDYTTAVENPYFGLVKPELGKTYLEILGGCIAHLYGGGNNATITENTTICINNDSPVLTETNVWPEAPNSTDENAIAQYKAKLAALAQRVGLSTYQSDLSSYAFNFARVFGGNNKAPMAIRPKWNLQAGVIRDIFSGGNQGAMTYYDNDTGYGGILLHVNPLESNADKLKIENVFGGCRMADVNPAKKNIIEEIIDGTTYPAGYAARVLIEGGDIQNVYGGNDISGNIYGGNAVGIHSNIKGDVYGGGNGSYAYTDNATLGGMEDYKDFYYDPGSSSVDALNEKRPNAEAVSIRVVGKYEKDGDGNVIANSVVPTVIGGAIYCGGNSASLRNDDSNKDASSQLKIGSYVIADKVFLGNNGANMVTENILKQYKSTVSIPVYDDEGNPTYDNDDKPITEEIPFSTMNLANDTQFEKYMDGCAMMIKPDVTFDPDYVPYSTYFGSFYCGGNVGSMKMDGAMEVSFNDKVVVFNKVVGGSNEANVIQSTYNAQYLGGLLGDPDTNGNKLILNFGGLKIEPKRWNSTYTPLAENENFVVDSMYYTSALGDGEFTATTTTTKEVGKTYYKMTDRGTDLIWNTVSAASGLNVNPITSGSGSSNAADLDRRLKGGNIYGGCYSNGHVNGNVIINLNETIHERDKIFDVTDEGDILYENTDNGDYTISKRNTGVILSEQGMDVLGSALNVFGGGYGGDSEIWGSATINLNKGYTFQIFGGGEMGAIGKAEKYNTTTQQLEYDYNSNYSTYINLNGSANHPGVARGAEGDSPDMAECEFIYGGAFEGLICGDTHIRLGNGRVFNTFAGSCNADIIGHTETYVGENGFPWIRDHIYGGNDLGGRIMGDKDFTDRIRSEVVNMVKPEYKEQVSKATTYMEYNQGRVRNILGGCFGDYDYENDPTYKVGTDEDCRVAQKPYLHNAFVNIRPNDNANNAIERVFGAGEGFPGDRDGDKLQDHSYVLIDIPDGITNFANTEIFGAGAYNGLGMRYPAADTFGENFNINEASAVIDLLRGRVSAAYGGSLDEGITRRTMVNVPENSTIIINNIFGGAYGNHILPPCDVYEANVNYHSANARLNGKIYGGNNNVRRTIYATVNIDVPVLAENGYLGTVYGAGKGLETWAEYTEVNLEDGAQVYEVYGGSELGNVLNAESVEMYMKAYKSKPADKLLEEDDTEWKNADRWTDQVGGTLKTEYQTKWQEVWKTAWTIGNYFVPNDNFDNYVENENGYTNLTNDEFVRIAEMDDRDYTGYTDAERNKRQYRYNTNVIIHAGATVGSYAYGGGYGKAGAELSGGVFGTTYIALLGGKVGKDIYAACTSGEVVDVFQAGAYSSSNTKGFTASANAYIQGGSCRNVYGAGWKGNVGSETLDGETHVVIGNKTGKTFTNGIPAIQRNAYAGGEGETKNGVSEGSTVFGSANVTLYNGYIGYTYNAAGTDDPETTDIDERYKEKIHDETATDYVSDDGIVGKNRLVEAGNIFGSGYVDYSDVDRSYVTVYDGVVRNSLYGGGEIGCVGRGSKEGSSVTISKGGATHVSMYGGLVMGDVFGGGRGYDNLKRVGTLGTAGYIYGTTEVNIHRGNIGTESSVAEGHGNVFGGGNLGYVYGTGTKNASDGYYYKGGVLTEDCKVVVSPYVVVTNATTVNGHSYAVGDFVPTDDLNTLAAGDSNWKTETGGNFDDLGITIGNAVFAGGNVSAGSDAVYANTNTVYGNATASVTDVFNKDLIAIGGDGVGGLYGDGNLTLVDGYRELNITNYGTDYYNLNSSISYDDYQRLNDRERAYFELQYQTETGHTDYYYQSKSLHYYEAGGVTYHQNQKITEAEYESLSSEEQKNWEEGSHTYQDGDKINEEEYELLDSSEKLNWDLLGFCTLYAGRIMNTIQRADFCGVFGSRIVLRGAQDRVPSAVDYTNYTINRVDELSLNCVTKSALTHGNYFGIYSVVNYLGALTSDVKFSSVRTTKSQESMYSDQGGETYFEWKKINLNNRKRNNGSSLNEVALSSGVWLEILDKKTETEKKKVYGPITGVVELALINVATGEGGGYVYAKNMHGELESDNSAGQVTLSAANQGAISYKQYTYKDVTATDKMQTSGNFVNSLKRIVDDCYPQSGSFYGTDAAPAHYWYIRGEFYLYDQYISAYTGSAQAYAEQVSIPLTITPESQGRLTLKDIHENLYAYWRDDDPNLANYKSQVDDKAIIINDITYHKNDPISYWEYSRLNDAQKVFFLGKTYVSMEDMTLSTGTYTKGQVLTTQEYTAVPENEYVCTTAFTATGEVEYEHGKVINQAQYEALSSDDKQHFESAKSLVHVTNAVSHDNGFLLSFAWDNPDVWNNYYQHLSTGTPQYVRSSKYDSDEFASYRDNYIPSPTFKCNTTGVYGQLNYQQGNLVDEQVYNQESPTLVNKLTTEQRDAQAEFKQAYVAKADCDFTVGDVHYYYVAGAPVPKTLWDTFGTNQDLFEAGYICTRTYQISDSEYILNGDVMTVTAYNDLPAAQKAVMSPAYICTKDGTWGGNYFEGGSNYPAVEFSNLSEAERANFSYNYDALDLLSENFDVNGVSAKKYQGMTHGITNQIPYCEKQAIDYTATYVGTDQKDLTKAVEVQRGTSTLTTDKLQQGDVLTNTVYESLVNEQLHFSPIVVSGADAENTVYYVVNEGIQVADNWYNVGNKMSAEIYNGLTEGQKAKVTPVYRSSLEDPPTGNDTKNYYFCTSDYTTKTQVKDVRKNSNTTYAAGQTVPKGAIIGPDDSEGYGALKNEHTGFTIDGIIPTETSTLYVSREIDINDLSQDKIVTVEYWYEYVESDETGSSYETIRERHVVNVHIHFESGVPIIGELLPPRTVLPGDVLGLNQPSVTKGAYEILGGGWETYSSLADAISHKNGTPYVTNQTQMYWYQNGNYVAYYAKTYLGKTYSNAVQISVANYHDMDKVMQDTEHHMYVDNPRVKRNSKIYIDNRECSSDPTKSELDLFSDFFNLSTGATLTGHEALDSHVTDCQNLDFILYSDVSPKKYNNWTPIGTPSHCFAGWLHGNGYTVSGLDKSLFGQLCGNIYNVGVMGSFTSGGVADSGSGHIENTWVSTTATPTGKPVIGTPASGAYVYNSYYPEEQNWTDHTSAANLNIIEKPMADFVNGQVAYLLNSNYLQARYLLFGNKSNAASASDKVERPVFFSYPDGTFDEVTVEDVTKNKEYQLSYTKNTTEWPWHSGNGFVEEYMGNGDYRYSDGIIPRQKDVSYTGTELFIPVFPDDYIYFGQTLSYDLYDNGDRGQHDTHPAGIVKYHTTESGDDVDNSKHLLLSLDPKTANRVYRAPAYFRNGTFGRSVTFNASAAFADSYKVNGANGTTTYKPHEGLTAIDFTGKGDITGYSGVAPGAEGVDFKDRSNSYGPLLDYYGLDAFMTSGITKNLLVYAPSAAAFTGEDDGTVKAQTAATKTLGVLNRYFNEPKYAEKEDDATTGMKAAYRAVDVVPEANQPKGHLVQMSGGFATDDSRNYSALTDHFLVDKQDFNAPIAYNFTGDKRMWYQRQPENFVGKKKEDMSGFIPNGAGWEGISLPFTADIVTTNAKGEITHFYNYTSGDEDHRKGHEYWLREFNGGSMKEGSSDIFVATFNKPEPGSSTKTYTNTFLWDYYYSHNARYDKNSDQYPDDTYKYYSEARTHSNYPNLANATPYIIGFPGERYYEFDLSGNFKAMTAKATIPELLSAQTITFASATGVSISVSDTELKDGRKSASDYTFVPNYGSKTLGSTAYILNTEDAVKDNRGSSYNVTTATAPATTLTAVPFRPYFMLKSDVPAARQTTRSVGQPVCSIIFSDEQTQLQGEDKPDPRDKEYGTLNIYTKRKKIVVESKLHDTTEVRIVNPAGITVATFDIEPGETVETRINNAGVYIVQTSDTRYTKKVAVR